MPDASAIATDRRMFFEIVPGLIACALAAVLVSLAGSLPPASVVETFEASEAELREAFQSAA